MDEADGRLRPISAIPSPVVVTRGQRIRRERRLRRLSVKTLAAEIGISERTLRSIELDERPDARTIDVVEAHLGLNEQTPPRTELPRIDEATNAELAVEVYRRLMQLSAADVVDVPLPADAIADPDAISDPDARPDPNQTRHPKESDG